MDKIVHIVHPTIPVETAAVRPTGERIEATLTQEGFNLNPEQMYRPATTVVVAPQAAALNPVSAPTPAPVDHLRVQCVERVSHLSGDDLLLLYDWLADHGYIPNR